MKRPQDSDIFGTKSQANAPRIVNNQRIDPNAAFQRKMDAQYDRYANSISCHNRSSFTTTQTQFTKVNEQAQFDENYHHSRKDCDMQSSIFYEPTLGNSRMSERSRITHKEVPKHAYNVKDLQQQANFGRKETLNREVINKPENKTEFKGNSSNIFGYNEKVDRNMVKNKVEKLIPSQMQWDQHDSVRYQDAPQQSNVNQKNNFAIIDESKSTVFEKIEEKFTNDQNNSNQSNKPQTIAKKQTVKKEIKALPQQSKVQVMVLKGWNPNLMEGLSKYCRINGTKILSFNFQGAGKGILTLERSKRWETVTDWLRKDAKLKIRVKN